LHGHPVAECADVVAQVQGIARGLQRNVVPYTP
jgi:hypothetical protein